MVTEENKLSKSASRVQEFLKAKGLEFKVIELSSSTRTANEAANAIGCKVAQIIKSLIFCTKDTKRPILVLASGVNRVDESLVSSLVLEKLEKADAAFALEVTGYAIGGIPPIAHKQQIITFIDEDLLQYSDLWAAAGTPNAVFCLKSELLESLTLGKVISIK